MAGYRESQRHISYELHVLLKTYLQVFCLLPYQKNSLSNSDSKLQEAPHRRSVSVSDGTSSQRSSALYCSMRFLFPGLCSSGECSSLGFMSQDREMQADEMVTPRSHILAEDEVKPKPSELRASSDSESCGKGSQGGKPFHVLSALPPFSNQLPDSCLPFSDCQVSQCKSWYYKPAYKNGLLPSPGAFISYVQKYSKVVANSLDWFWLYKRQVISNYENYLHNLIYCYSLCEDLMMVPYP